MKAEWNREDQERLKAIAHRYADRAMMDGSVIRKTGEIIPKESA